MDGFGDVRGVVILLISFFTDVTMQAYGFSLVDFGDL